jgi:hypothetical protein
VQAARIAGFASSIGAGFAEIGFIFESFTSSSSTLRCSENCIMKRTSLPQPHGYQLEYRRCLHCGGICAKGHAVRTAHTKETNRASLNEPKAHPCISSRAELSLRAWEAVLHTREPAEAPIVEPLTTVLANKIMMRVFPYPWRGVELAKLYGVL